MKSILKYWRKDLLAGLSVSFVALPLSMGIALAIGYPIQAGIFAAVVGGMLGWVLGGTHVGIKGPGAGGIVVLIAAYTVFKEAGVYNSPLLILLAATFFAGLLLMLVGFLRLGKYAQILPSGAINGFLAGIGFIIVVTQISKLLGYNSLAVGPVDTLAEIPENILKSNPITVFLGVISLVILVFHKNIPSRTLRAIPAAIWVLLVNVLIVVVFGLQHEKEFSLLGLSSQSGPDYLITIDKHIFSTINQPSFEAINTSVFWIQTFNIFIILLVENLLSAKAIDKIDPLNRKTNLNHDLSSSGLATAVSSVIGGMPAITVIARSSVNVNVGGLTRLSNFIHGLILVVLLLVAIPLLNLIPKTSLAAVLVVAGFKLCSPRVFNKDFQKGWEQLFIFFITFYATIRYGLILGIVFGSIMDYLLSFFLADNKFTKFWKASLSPFIKLSEAPKGYVMQLKGVLTFLSLLKIENQLNLMQRGKEVKVDLSESQVVDRTVLEYLSNESLLYEKNGGIMDIIGLKNHHSSSPHPAALHLLNTTWKKNALHTTRQVKLKRLSLSNNLNFVPDIDYRIGHYQTFPYFKTRPFEYRFNTLKGNWDNKINFEIADVLFHQGELSAQDNLKTTILSFSTQKIIPEFSIEKFSFYDKLKGLALSEKNSIQFSTLEDEVQIIGEDQDAINAYFTDDLINYLSSNAAYNIESNGKEILVFKSFKTASLAELKEILTFAEKLSELL